MHKIYLSIPNVFTVRRAFIYFLRLVDNIQSIVSATAPCVKEKELDFPRKGAPGNKSHAQINLLYLPIFCYLFASFFSLDSTLQQCRPHICHRHHRLYPWRKICHVEKFQISVKNLNNLWSFIEIHAIFVLNLCGEKMTNMRSEKVDAVFCR